VSALDRVGQESLVNIQKHAKASKVTLRLDLVGLAEGQIDRRAEGRLGLRLLTDRVESLGAGSRSCPSPAAGPGGGRDPGGADLRRVTLTAGARGTRQGRLSGKVTGPTPGRWSRAQIAAVVRSLTPRLR
jgi:hypothetical protein